MQNTANEIRLSRVGSEICRRDSNKLIEIAGQDLDIDLKKNISMNVSAGTGKIKSKKGSA